jgi:hypothetical protein
MNRKSMIMLVSLSCVCSLGSLHAFGGTLPISITSEEPYLVPVGQCEGVIAELTKPDRPIINEETEYTGSTCHWSIETTIQGGSPVIPEPTTDTGDTFGYWIYIDITPPSSNLYVVNIAAYAYWNVWEQGTNRYLRMENFGLGIYDWIVFAYNQ